MISASQKRLLWMLAGFLALGLLPKALPALRDVFILHLLAAVAILVVAILYGVSQLLRLAYVCFKRAPLNPVLGNVVFAVAIGLLFLVETLATRFLPNALPTGSHMAEFDSAVWRDPESARYREDGPTPRQQMLAAAIAELEGGRTRAEVIELMGEPNSKDFPLGIGDSDIHYVTGPQRDAFFGLDHEWLFIWFDESGRFERYSIYVD